MLKRRYIPCLLGAALLAFLPTRTGRVLAQGAICGPFTDVASSNGFCPFILEAFITSITQGTSPTTFNPNDPVTRAQAATFFTRTMDQTLHRGTVRTAMGKSWAPSSTFGGVATEVGGAVNDIVTDGIYLWIARADGKILTVNAANRRLIETWSLAAGAGVPRKLGVFAGLVWIADDQGHLYNFNPTGQAGTATQVSNVTGILPGFPTLAFDGTNVWFASSGGTKISVYQVSSPVGITFSPGANVEGLVFDGTDMWVLTADSHLLKMTIPTPGAAIPAVEETLTIPGPVSDCRMMYDGNNIWIPIGTTETVYVVRPTQNLASLPSSIVKNEAIPGVGFPYVAAYDGENVMIGGLINGTVALYKATNLNRIRTFDSGANGVRGIASDGRTFNIGDVNSTRFYQY
jgi:hypothetical protein